MKLNTFIYYFDFFNNSFNLNYKLSSSYNTLLGAILSSIYIIFFIGIFLYYFNMIFSRKHFSIIYNSQYQSDLYIDLSKTTIIFYLLDNSNNLILEKNIFNISVNYIEIFFDSKTFNITQNSYNIPIENCSYDSNLKLIKNNKFSIYNDFTISKFNCILNENLNKIKIEGKRGTKYYRYLKFQIKKCDNSSNNNSCINKNSPIYDNFYLTFDLIQNEINHFSYKNYIKKTTKLNYFSVNSQIKKEYNIKLNKGIYESDNGLIFSNIETKDFFTVGGIDYEFSLNSNSNDDLFFINIISNEIVEKYKRIYLKLQDILAKIVSIINSTFIIIKIILNLFTKKLMQIDIINSLFFSNNNFFKKDKKIFFDQNESSIININKKNSMRNIENKNETNILNLKKLDKIQNVQKYKSCIQNNNQFQNKIITFFYPNKNPIKLNCLDYIIPFCINKKRKKNINILCSYINIIKSNISIEKIFFFNYNNYPT